MNMPHDNATSSPFPTTENDELFTKYGQQLRVYTQEELETAATSWHLFVSEAMTPAFYLKLLVISEGAMCEATILWDALGAHRQRGLVKYITRSASHYTTRFDAVCGAERTYNRAFADLFDRQLLVRLPTARFRGFNFRLDWVALSQRIDSMQGKVFPGLDADIDEVIQ